eukprot:scaffold2886_cov398-Prasinococcus_capsulatus_cf.AAC.13
MALLASICRSPLWSAGPEALLWPGDAPSRTRRRWQKHRSVALRLLPDEALRVEPPPGAARVTPSWPGAAAFSPALGWCAGRNAPRPLGGSIFHLRAPVSSHGGWQRSDARLGPGVARLSLATRALPAPRPAPARLASRRPRPSSLRSSSSPGSHCAGPSTVGSCLGGNPSFLGSYLGILPTCSRYPT